VGAVGIDILGPLAVADEGAERGAALAQHPFIAADVERTVGKPAFGHGRSGIGEFHLPGKVILIVE
jgi:hypothetical protein